MISALDINKLIASLLISQDHNGQLQIADDVSDRIFLQILGHGFVFPLV